MDIVRAALLQTFEFYLDDDRYAVPTLKLVVADDEGFALAAAQRLLDESGHHRGVEVCVAGQRLAGLGTFASRRSPASSEPTAED